MYLPEDDPQTILDLIEFLYRGVLPIFDATSNHEKDFYQLLDLFYFSEKICLSVLSNAIMNRILYSFESYGSTFSVLSMAKIMAKTTPGSKLRQFCFISTASRFYLSTSKRVAWPTACAELSQFCPEFGSGVFQVLCRPEAHTEKHSKCLKLEECFEPCHEFHTHRHGDEKTCPLHEKRFSELVATLDASPAIAPVSA